MRYFPADILEEARLAIKAHVPIGDVSRRLGVDSEELRQVLGMTATLSPNRVKKNAKKAAQLTDAEQTRLISRIRNLFELEKWSTERIAEVVELPRSEVIRIIQTSTAVVAKPE